MSETPETAPPVAPPPPAPSPEAPPVAPGAGTVGEATGSVANSVAVNDLKTETALLVGQINFATQYLPDAAGLRVFSVEQTWTVSTDHEAQAAELFVGDRQALDRMANELHTRRILLITGPERSGKATTALYLSTQIAQRGALSPTRVVDPLSRQVRIDVRKLAEAAKDFGGRVTVFTDAFARGNPDLLDFFRRDDGIRWNQLCETLRANKAYLVFTSETTAVDEVRQQLAQHIACVDVAPLAPALVLDALERRISWLEKRELISDEHVRIVREGREQIVDVLKTVHSVAMFLDQFGRGDTDLAAALKRFNDVDYWFSRVLSTDIDAWCFALTLALAETARPDEDVGWLEFDRLRRAITDAVKGSAELFPRRRLRAEADEDIDERSAAEALCDDHLLATCRAEVTRESGHLGDVVRFVDASYASAIYQAVLTRNRRVLTAILPAIRKVAEDRRLGSYPVRTLAAQVLGRVGEVDPRSVSLPLARDHWVNLPDRGLRPLVGRLLQGMRASKNDSYRRAALAAVDSLAGGSDDKANDRLLTAISAYAQLGVGEHAVAMERLGAIAVGTLAPVMEDMQQIARVAERVDRALTRTRSAGIAEDLLEHRVRLGYLAKRVLKDHVTTLIALERAVAYLCIMNDPVKVLHSMRDWISKGGPSAGTLVAMLFLHGGIAEEMETLASGASTLAGGAVASPILIALARGGNAVESFAAFLADVYDTVHSTFTLPSDVQREFQEEFTECLGWWARGATVHERYRESVVSLFALLATIRGGAVRNDLYALLASPEFASDHAMRSFAKDVRMTIARRAEARDGKE